MAILQADCKVLYVVVLGMFQSEIKVSSVLLDTRVIKITDNLPLSDLDTVRTDGAQGVFGFMGTDAAGSLSGR